MLSSLPCVSYGVVFHQEVLMQANSLLIIPCSRRLVPTADVRYAKLRPFLESAVTWFRKPFALLFVARPHLRLLQTLLLIHESLDCPVWRRAQ